MTFDQLGLAAPLLRAVKDKGYTQPSPIQAEAIPPILAGGDVMAAAQTGTGKTAGFVLPILQLLSASAPAHPHRIRALIITPTRELAAQVGESVVTYGRHLPLKSTVVFGGVKINPQIATLRKGVDILIATPGRLLDLHQQGEVRFNEIEILVLDEADRMLDMGFIHDIRRLLKLLPPRRQNLLFSATFANEIRQLTRTILHNPTEVEVSPPNATAERVEQWIYPVDKKSKSAVLRQLVVERDWQQVLVFSRTKHGANKLAQQLEKAGINAAAIHGNKSQSARTRALAGFKGGEIRVLVATDIAARGLDIAQLPQVVNFDLPNVPEDYVHRIGRTGRAGAAGRAYSLVCADEIKQLNDIQQVIQRHLAREYVDGFEPDHEVPPSAPLRKPRSEGGGRRLHKSADGGNHTSRGRGSEGHKRPRRRNNRSGNKSRQAGGGNNR
jgi:ATP-dependent RNA helicase RhlE